MNTLTKIHAICRMYRQAVENNNETLKKRFQNRANDLYLETYGTEYSMDPIRENILFNIANGCTDFYFMEEVRRIEKALSAR